MSTFTEWNGPSAGRGASTKDVLALIDAYNQMNALLSKHIESTSTDDVHRLGTALQEAITTLENSINAALSAKADKSTADGLLETVAAHETALGVEASRAEAAEAALESSIGVEASRASAMEAELQAAVEALEASVDDFRLAYEQRTGQIEFDDELTTTITGIVEATEYFIGTLKARKLIDFIEWETFNAQYAGTGINDATTGTHGVYILGKMSEEWIPDKGFADTAAPKAARAYVKYINDRPFDLIVDMTATSGETGSMSCLASFEKPWTLDDPADAWEDMTLHLLTNTDSSGVRHVYLAISAKGLSGQSTTFHVAGENFIPGGTVNGVTGRIAFTRVKQGFNGSRANLDDLRVEALNDAYGKIILKVEYNNDILGTKRKDLYIADPSYEGVYFLRRPSVIYTPDADDTNDENIASEIAPVLTSLDLDAVSSGGSLKGIIVFWPQWEDAEANGKAIKRAINVPEGWLACDGSEVSAEEYPGLAEKLGQSGETLALPVIDYAIIRVLDLFEGIGLKEEATSIRVLTHKELTEAIVTVQQNVEAEAEERIAADEALQANIDAEEAARIAADEELQANIDAEAAAREAADTVLQENIDAEASTRTAADEALQANIDAEAAVREAADTVLQENIDTEEAARIAADTQLQANIDAEAAAREAADTVLQGNIDAEASARDLADATLQSNIDTEEAARIAADTQLQANIDAEAAARTAADEAEATARQSADTALQAAIDAEITARRDADTTLQAAIDAETDARRSADTTLQAGIDAEATARIAADANLQAQIDQEIASRMAADSAQQSSIEMLDATKAESWTGTQSEFDAAKDGLEDGTIVLSEDELEDE